MPSVLDDARAYLGRSLDDILQELGPDVDPAEGDDYGQLQDLTSVDGAGVLPGLLFFLDGQVELIYLEGDVLADLSPSDLAAQLGDDPAWLDSRAGKKANLMVYAEQGVAYSEQNGTTLHYVEVFRPRSQEAYEAEIYRQPGPFIR